MPSDPRWPDLLTAPDSAAARPVATPRHRSAGSSGAEPTPHADKILAAWLAGVLALMLGTGAGLAWIALAIIPRSTAPPATRTALAVVTDSHGRMVAGALLAVDSRGADCLLLPGDLTVDVPGEGRTSLAAAVSRSGGTAAAGLAQAVGVRVDGTWVIGEQELAELVEAVGGVQIAVSESARGPGAVGSTGREAQVLTGQQAAVYATARETGESEEQRLHRFGAVFYALMEALPDDGERRAAALRDVQPQQATTLPLPAVRQLLAALHERADAEEFADVMLPMASSSASGGLGVDHARLAALLVGRRPLAAARISDV